MHEHRSLRREIRSEMRELLHVAALWRPMRELEERHARLRSRLVIFFVVSLVVDSVMTLTVFFSERETRTTCQENCFDGFFPAFEWSTSQLLVGGSSYAVHSSFGHLLELFAHGYGVTVIAALAGAFASFFTSQPTSNNNRTSVG